MKNKKPNIIVIMADEMKATASHLYGNDFCKTPALERLAKDGVLYEYAYTPHPLCVPARISLWTSTFPHSHKKMTNQNLIGDNYNAFKLWKDMGYHTALIGKNHCFEKDDYDNLFDTWCEIGHIGLKNVRPIKGMDWVVPVDKINEATAIRYNMPLKTPAVEYAFTDYPEENYTSNVIAKQTDKFLEDRGDEPFALWVSIPDPHMPFEAPERYKDIYNKDTMMMPPWSDDEYAKMPERTKVLYEMLNMKENPSSDVINVMTTYYAMVEMLDDAIGSILDSLDRLGLKENTIVVFCADHGDFIGEHMMVNKGGAFYDCLTRIPLIVSYPNSGISGKIDTSMTNLIDIVPTILKLQNVAIPEEFQGRPLPTITDEYPRDRTYSEYGAGEEFFTMDELQSKKVTHGLKPFRDSLVKREAEGKRKMVRTKNWKFIYDPMGDSAELYDMVNDPWELNNVADDIKNRDKVDELKQDILNWREATGDVI